MFSFLGNTKVRRGPGVKEFRRKLFVESLEDRRVLAGNVTATLSGGNLTLFGDALDNEVTITFTGANAVTVTGIGTTINNVAAGTPLAFPGVTGSITANLNAGNDDLTIVGANFSLTGGGISYNGGTGDNDFTLDDLTLATALSVNNSANPAVPASANVTDIDNLDAASITVTNGSRNSTVTLIGESSTTGNVSVTNLGGPGTTHTVTVNNLSTAVPNSIGGNLSINNLGPSASYTVAVDETTVAGNVSVVNGNATGPASIRFGDTALVFVGGTLTAINGNSSTNTIRLDRISVGAEKNTTLINGNATAGDNLISVGAGTATLGGGLTAINGNATGGNKIEIEGGTIGTLGGALNSVHLQNGNVGVGFVSEVELGDAVNVTVPDGSMTILDGTGNGLVEFVRGTIAGDLQILTNAGNDIVGIGAGATVNVLGTTNVLTAAGNDTLNIASPAGTANLDRVFAFLGTGDDILNIGAGAAGSNAFDNLADFLFDGGEGGESVVGDTANVFAVVFATVGSGPGSTRLINFETINLLP